MKIERKDVEVLLGQLIEIYSPYFEEDKIMEFVHTWLRERELPANYHYYEDHKVTKFKGKNIIGQLNDKPGKNILINCHLDTVMICENWTKEPLIPEIIDNKMYGLGALDMKSGAVATLLAIEAFKKHVKSFNGTITYNFVSDEEGPYGLGTNYIIHDGLIDNVDVAIVPEPSAGFTGLDFPCLCLGARGGYAYTVEVYGKSAHAANPNQGICAIEAASKIIMALKESELKVDPYLGSGDICIIEMQGGGAACSVADKASFKVFRHIVNGENKDTLINEVARAVKKAGADIEYKVIFRDAPTPDSDGFLPYTVDPNNSFAVSFKETIKKVTNKEATISYFSSIGDFCYLGSRLKIPTLVFGPGGKNYHSADEYVNLDDVIKTSQVLYEYLIKVLKASI